MIMVKCLTKLMCIFFPAFALCGCARMSVIYSGDSMSSTKKTNSEYQMSGDGGREEIQRLSSQEWLVTGGTFYVKQEDDIYEEREFPAAVQDILHEEDNKVLYLGKEGNRLVVERRNGFVIYDFTTDDMIRIKVEYGHSDWQILHDNLYYIELNENDEQNLMVYDIQSDETKEINLGEYTPLQFHVREDGAIGILVSNNENNSYCFWSEQHVTYVLDEDVHRGWTYIRDYNENGIIVEREYQSSSLQGTKIYQIREEGTISVLLDLESCNINKVPEGELLFLEDCILAIDFLSGRIEMYDYKLCYIQELFWDIDVKEDMVFVRYCVSNEKIMGVWKNEEEAFLKVVELK